MMHCGGGGGGGAGGGQILAGAEDFQRSSFLAGR